jgi:two-component system sensor histidine kinase KdpD
MAKDASLGQACGETRPPARAEGARESGWLLESGRRGRLWLLVGYAPRAGKTRRLLEVGRQLGQDGLDAVLAHLDPRDRGELARLAPGLEVIAPRRVEYRGMAVAELDLEAVLARQIGRAHV